MELPLSKVLILTRVSACVALRKDRLLRKELHRAMAAGLSVPRIREVILQSYLFAGYAAAINAFVVLNELAAGDPRFFQEEDHHPSLAKWKSRGEDFCRKIYGSRYEKLVHNMKQLHPDLAEWMLWEGYGKVLSRPFLSPRVRELLIVGMTAVLNVERQFHSHVKGALHMGATNKELHAVLRSVTSLMHPSVFLRFQKLLKELTAKTPTE
jgi:alkylhydroperoxidase/carboxymuconolactone decarboxylase family protein YurZ